MKTLSIAETRRDFCSLASNVIDTGEAIVISRYGQPSLVLMKYAPEAVAKMAKTAARPPRCEDTPLFGMWADRKDMEDPRAWIEKHREERRKRLFQ